MLISAYIMAIPLTGNASCMDMQTLNMPVHNAINMKVGAAAKLRSPAAAAAASPLPTLAALDRVEVADNVRERIAELVWVGAQVIVTDNARSDEMDYDTDIIVSTR